jgi:hypothetical protein
MNEEEEGDLHPKIVSGNSITTIGPLICSLSATNAITTTRTEAGRYGKDE